MTCLWCMFSCEDDMFDDISDGNMEDEEEMCGVMPKQPTADLDFDALLRQATKTLKTKQRH